MAILLTLLAALILMVKTSAVIALGDAGEIRKFQGVWIGSSVTAKRQRHAGAVIPRDLDLAIRKTKAGFDLTWNPLSRRRAGWVEARLVATGKHGAFAAATVDPPLGGEEWLWAEIVEDRLILYESRRGEDRVAYLARYALSVSNGRMTIGYTLWQGDEVLESLDGTLSRAKVVF